MYFFLFAARFIPSRLSTAFAKRNLFSEAAKCKDDDDKCVCVWGGLCGFLFLVFHCQYSLYGSFIVCINVIGSDG